MLKKVMLFSLFLLALQCKPTPKEIVFEVDNQKILQAAINAYGDNYALLLADSLSAKNIEQNLFKYFHEVESTELNLISRTHLWCFGVHCIYPIIYINNGLFEYAFPFNDDENFYGYHFSEQDENAIDTLVYLTQQNDAQDEIMLDDHLSFVAGKLQIQTNPHKLNQLITLVADSLLKMEEIDLAEITQLKEEIAEENIPNHTLISKRCISSFQSTANEVINGLQNGRRYFFRGKGNAGIWEFQLLPINNREGDRQGQYYFAIRVLNYECIAPQILL